MTAVFARRVPTLWHGRGVARQVTGRLTAGREALVVSDAALPHLAPTERTLKRMEVDAGSMDAAAVATIATDIRRHRPDVIVAVGGGSVLDATKIAALALAPGRVFEFVLDHASRSALTFLPDAPPPVDVIAIPTTLGTSSETNSVGIMTADAGHRLIVGRSLTPRHAVIDPDNLKTLTPAAVREGALEAFLRLAGASTSPRRTARGKADAVALARALLDAVACAEGSDPASDSASDTLQAATRLRLARLSAATQRSAALRGDDPYSARHWYLANEVSFALGARKMAATAAVVSAVWRRICSGDRRWGDRQSLEEFWSGVVGGAALPPDPASGIMMLVDRWGITLPPRPSLNALRRIAIAVEQSWGHRYPMLPGLRVEDFVDVLCDSRWSTQPGRPDAPAFDDRCRGGE